MSRALTFEEEKLQIEGAEDEKGGAAMERILQGRARWHSKSS